MAYGSLEEALLVGWEIERAYVCTAHPDHSASASVNSITGLFYCYACGHRGKADKNSVQITDEGLNRYLARLKQRIFPDQDRYSESWLNTFDAGGPGAYWLSRFDLATSRYYRLGTAPGVATYPMRNNVGEVLGLVTRDISGERPQRYLYPARVQVGNYLIDYHRVDSDTIVLCEGMTDVAAVYQTGHHVALGCYKAGLTATQAQLIRKYAPKNILVGFDQDAAGQQGYQTVVRELGRQFPVERLWWSDYDDLAAIPLSERSAMLNQVLGEPVSETPLTMVNTYA